MIQGDTIRLQCHFKSFNGQSVDPINVTLTIYDKDKNQVEQYELDDTNKENVGVYFYDYSPPLELDEFIFEFKGVYNDKPILARDLVQVKFI
ncbi:hypothetical protein LIZ76_15775 [Caldibacillus sp. 210928-DFI.2.22]|uniref:hypothetical protein n=1 Tax=unclassified Caldibacillus TaxID=2641266 RepID=UPI001D0919F7|nr:MULTISPECIES: hypothetical protein [unclassified Caldibacillus]MCB7071384.1 hypothetical protein [Caldibacillus sp. 210928-DFI.2.22]MCB7073740.1 hypothetical protein [Caldibacillus sp. 210928-DFI.2.18]